MHHQKMNHGHGSQCGCSCSSMGRSFFTKEEKVEKLKLYRKQLEKEISGLDAALEELGQSK